MPMEPPAPVLFSTKNGWPRRCERRSVKIRAATSVLPPAAKGTITVTGLVGQFSACTGEIVIAAANARADVHGDLLPNEEALTSSAARPLVPVALTAFAPVTPSSAARR